MNWIKSKRIKLKTRRTFLKQGTCSRTFFYILNREYGFTMAQEEQAADPLAGGIVQQGYQCGMIWGAALGAGAESYRRYSDLDVAKGMAIKATRQILESFILTAKSADCIDISKSNWNSKLGIAKFFFTGKVATCLNLASKWAPKAINAVDDGFSLGTRDIKPQTVNCASEVVRLMGGDKKEEIMVAGFAGGMGLSGKGCGALAAAVWMNSLMRIRKEIFKYSLSDSELDELVKSFYLSTNYEMECSKICARQFATIEEHSEYIKAGGCNTLIQTIATSGIPKISEI